MEVFNISTKIKLVTTDCANCGVVFAIPDRLDDKFREYGSTFYCPNGHTLTYGKSESMKLRHKLDQREAELERTHTRLDGALKEISNKKGQITKLRNRVQAGVCTECHRHFENLQRHMESKHS
ncbi:hypothetical protein LCGC14_2207210 [marine sediment metagenome]|uniref:C2H2-type domain-containing protein n=1 Tax=marine sediment metagenome TaxID=412755 RepID=A0A0F9GAV3_9ZZZZ